MLGDCSFQQAQPFGNNPYQLGSAWSIAREEQTYLEFPGSRGNQLPPTRETSPGYPSSLEPDRGFPGRCSILWVFLKTSCPAPAGLHAELQMSSASELTL